MIKNLLNPAKPYTVIALNFQFPKYFHWIWENAAHRLCADGGANRVNRYYEENKHLVMKPPEVVVGDFDSVKKETRAKFERMGTEFKKIHNQDYNDVQKILMVTTKRLPKDPIYIVGGIGGRFDHTIAVLQAALNANGPRIVILDDFNLLTWITPKDKGIIPPKKWSTGICGMLPIAGPVRKVTTHGLKWDVDCPIEMTGLISSSNELVKDEISIKTTDPFLWMNRIRSPFSSKV